MDTETLFLSRRAGKLYRMKEPPTYGVDAEVCRTKTWLRSAEISQITRPLFHLTSR